MAEGMSRLNQHVLDTSRWETAGHMRASDECAGLDASIEARREMARPTAPHEGVQRVVEADIIPRLVLDRRAAEVAENAAGPVEIVRFAELLLACGDEAKVTDHVAAFRSRGHTVEDVYLDLFQPAARHIGDVWAADLCSFVDVTLALGTLHRMMREFSPEFHKDSRLDAARRALLVPLPGDQHTFGLSMVAEFFRRSGWGVWTTPFATERDLGAALRETWFTVVGFSVSLVGQLDQLARVIDLVRRKSCNASVGVLVGGPLFVGHPEHVARVGADAFGQDARQAVFQAECFAARMAGR